MIFLYSLLKIIQVYIVTVELFFDMPTICCKCFKVFLIFLLPSCDSVKQCLFTGKITYFVVNTKS
jgi:hypothetical protein